MPAAAVAEGPSGSRRGAPTGSTGWAVTLVGASVLWAGGGLIARHSPMSGPQFAFWRSLTGASVYQLVLAARGVRPRVEHLRASAVGGVGFGLSVLFVFAAFKSTSMTSANVITALQPILLGVVATRLHRDGLPRGGAAAMAAALAGTLVVVAGSSGGGTWSLRGDLLAVGGVVVGCLYPIGTKSARRSLTALEFQAGCLWVSTAVTLVGVLVIEGSPVVPTPAGWLHVAGIVAVGGSGHLVFSWAQHHVSVATSSVVMLSEIVASSLGAAVWFGEPITALQVVGMLMVGAGVAAWVVRDAARESGDAAAVTDGFVADLPG